MASQLNVALVYVGHWCAWSNLLTFIHGSLYNRALADVRSTGAGINWLYRTLLFRLQLNWVTIGRASIARAAHAFSAEIKYQHSNGLNVKRVHI